MCRCGNSIEPRLRALQARYLDPATRCVQLLKDLKPFEAVLDQLHKSLVTVSPFATYDDYFTALYRYGRHPVIARQLSDIRAFFKELCTCVDCEPRIEHEAREFALPPTPWLVAESVSDDDVLDAHLLEVYPVNATVGYGLRYVGTEPLPAGKLLCFYHGELKTERQKDQLTNVEQHYYIATLDFQTYVDAADYGSLGRFINHRCQPNASMTVVNYRGSLAIVVAALTDIAPGEEISTDCAWRAQRPLTRTSVFAQTAGRRPADRQCRATARRRSAAAS